MNRTDKKEIVMNRINSSSLFHFTQSWDTFEKIIMNGLRYSFAFEQYSKEIIQSYLNPYWSQEDNLEVANGVAIPMISFCDIPITRASQHIEKYGKYMIGFDKINFTKAFENLINPVLYVHSPNLRDAIKLFGLENAKAYRELFDFVSDKNAINEIKTSQDLLNTADIKSKIEATTETRFLSNFLLGLVKPIADGDHYYYDEREWRLFLPENAKGVNWIWGITEDEHKLNKNKWNEELENYEDGEDVFIRIPWECYDEYITHIVVSKEEEVETLIELIMDSDKLLGYENDVDYSRMKLISKITSFERIEKDF